MYGFLKNLLPQIFGKDLKQHHTHIDASVSKNINFILNAIESICQLMPKDSTSDNWRNYFFLMKDTVIDMPNRHGIKKVKLIWKNMQGGMGSWNDYYIPHVDKNIMIEQNEILQKHCATLSHYINHIEPDDNPTS
jgi:hypothetical protein